MAKISATARRTTDEEGWFGTLVELTTAAGESTKKKQSIKFHCEQHADSSNINYFMA
jgi:hypothetical protein